MPLDLNRDRVSARGKSLYVGQQKFWVRGTSYGAFRPDAEGREYRNLGQIRRDFRHMAASGFTTVRIPHTTPPPDVLDVAHEEGLRVMVGLSAEQYVGYLADPFKRSPAERVLEDRVRACQGHPALLCYALGNEIPASMVRWLGREAVERYLLRLFTRVKSEDPDSLVTYVNYPSTEFLQLPFLDLVAFNVYLESEDRLRAYLARLQHLAGERPLLMSELGLDSLRNGEAQQADSLDWQIRTTFAAGCCGAVVFSWTDEWFRGGADVEDWAFGLTDRARNSKPALGAVQAAFADVPAPARPEWPRISVVVCVYNGAGTIRDCCQGLLELDYPDFEVIVVDDGSTDQSGGIAAEYGFRVIQTENRGLSHARNVGLEAATGAVVAYTDADARPDPHWLTYLADAFVTSSHAGVGGWNIAPEGDGLIADCVASAPGGPVHVLLSDTVAEHIPGCCMAFWKDRLTAIGGFDPQFRTAGDDVDVCWRLQEQGWTLGFSAGAVVWHHYRNTLPGYWRQQVGYGRAEAQLERKWPGKYNAAGHVTWGGRLYGRGLTRSILRRGRIYQGTWGSAPFQHLEEREPGLVAMLPMMPEWYLLVGLLGLLSLMGIWWPALRPAVPLLAAAIGAMAVHAWTSARAVRLQGTGVSRPGRFLRRLVVGGLHLLQPAARLIGRLDQGLTMWRVRGPVRRSWPIRRTYPLVVTTWTAPDARLRGLQRALEQRGAVVFRGGDYDRWDLEVRGGLFAGARLLMATEDSGSGTQIVRVRTWPRTSAWLAVGAGLLLAVAVAAIPVGAPGVILMASALVTLFVWRGIAESARAAGALQEALVACQLVASADRARLPALRPESGR